MQYLGDIGKSYYCLLKVSYEYRNFAGAGSSIAAGFPSTHDLTEIVLSGHGVTGHPDASYYLDETALSDEKTRLANNMARRLHAEAERYYSAYHQRSVNYEDLFYLANQASDDLSGEMENPAIRAFVNELKSDMLPLINTSQNFEYDKLNSLLSETCNYIADIVWRSLGTIEPKLLGQLNLIAHACDSTNVTSISTLCHDTHVEMFLREKGIALSDGFSKPEADVRYWNGDFSSDGKTPFLKLHGSVDWFHLCPAGGDWYDVRIGIIPPNVYCYRTQTHEGVRQDPFDGRPLLLIGTFNKISEYSSGVFRELHYRFRSTISKADQMILCGYGFGDKGINAEIIEWYYDKRGRRLIIIHPDTDSLIATARGAIRNKWSDWKEKGSILCINKQFEDVDSDEFKEAIGY